MIKSVSILPRLATGIFVEKFLFYGRLFLFFPVLRRGSAVACIDLMVEIVSILPRLATGIALTVSPEPSDKFLFFPVLRRGSDTIP